MVLLIPNAIKKIRSDERKRIRAALVELAGRQGNGQGTLSIDEALKVLQDDAESRS